MPIKTANSFAKLVELVREHGGSRMLLDDSSSGGPRELPPLHLRGEIRLVTGQVIWAMLAETLLDERLASASLAGGLWARLSFQKVNPSAQDRRIVDAMVELRLAGIGWWFPTADCHILMPAPALRVRGGVLDNDQGAAVTTAIGTKYYFLRGIRLSPRVYWQIVNRTMTLQTS